MAYNCLLQGLWFEAAAWAEQELALSRSVGGFGLPTALKHRGWALTSTGDLALAIVDFKEGIDITQKRHDEAENIRLTRRLAEAYDRQGRWKMSNELFQSQIRREEQFGRLIARANDLGLLGISFLRQGNLHEAEWRLAESLRDAHIDFQPRTLIALGHVHLKRGDALEARRHYQQAIDTSRGNAYFIAEARIGLLLASLLVPNNDALADLSAEIEKACAANGYNDLLAYLHLIRASVAWRHAGMPPDAAFSSFIQNAERAMIYEIRFNQFLLDEVFSAENVSPLVPPILHMCVARPVEGREALESIRDWWTSARNELVTDGDETKANAPIGIPLARAEQISRSYEPGDGSSQPTILKQLNHTLSTLKAA